MAGPARSGQSQLVLAAPSASAGGFSFTLNCKANKTYSIVYKDSLADPVWQKWQDIPAQGTDFSIVITIPASTGGHHFFKVVTPQLP